MEDSDIIKRISEGYRELSGRTESEVTPLPRSGSDRRYFRISDAGKSIIGAFNANPEENEAFIGFTDHFRKKQLPVPEIYGFLPENLFIICRILVTITFIHGYIRGLI